MHYNTQPNHPDYHWTQFLRQANPDNGPVARIEIAELIDNLDQYPSRDLSDSALRQLHELRYRRRHSYLSKFLVKICLLQYLFR